MDKLWCLGKISLDSNSSLLTVNESPKFYDVQQRPQVPMEAVFSRCNEKIAWPDLPARFIVLAVCVVSAAAKLAMSARPRRRC